MKKNLRFAAIITAFGIALAFAGCKNASDDTAALMALAAASGGTSQTGNGSGGSNSPNDNGSSNPFTGTVWGLVVNGTLQTSAEMDFSFTSSTKVTYFGREYTYTVENGRIAHISNGSVGDFEISSLDPSSATFSVTGSAQKANYKKRTGPVNGGSGGTRRDPTVDHIDAHFINIKSGIVNGSVRCDWKSAKTGETVPIRVEPASGYKLGSLTVTTEEITSTVAAALNASSGLWEFTMPSACVTVNATFIPQ